MEYSPKGKVRQRRHSDGVVQYLVKDGSTAHWVNSDQLSSPEDKKEVEIFMV